VTALKSAIQSLGKRLGIKGRDLFQPVRAALTGRTHGPELPLLGELLGRERSHRPPALRWPGRRPS
jgi:nondiscriminating glutamyl-tRNA synthetase